MSTPLTQAVQQVEEFVARDGWDQTPRMFALAWASELVSTEPDLAEELGISPTDAGFVPIEQDWTDEEQPLDALLSAIGWPEEVQGCVITLERIVLPDSSSLACYMVRRMTRLLGNLEVDTERMQHNLSSLHGVVFSQSVLLALVEGGMTRDDAYRIVQSAAATAMQTGTNLHDVLVADKSVSLSAEQIAVAFDVLRVLRHAGRAVDSFVDNH